MELDKRAANKQIMKQKKFAKNLKGLVCDTMYMSCAFNHTYHCRVASSSQNKYMAKGTHKSCSRISSGG